MAERTEDGGASRCIDHGERYDLIVVGGGPSGLFCAQNCLPGNLHPDNIRHESRRKGGMTGPAGRKAPKILVLEKKGSLGRKLLISGLGRCNITHDGDIQSFLQHYGDRGRFLRPALLGFTNLDLISFFKERGLNMIRQKSGKIFPDTMRSADVLNILTEECRAKGIIIKCGQAVSSIEKVDGGFFVCSQSRSMDAGHDMERADRTEIYSGTTLVLATGGCSYPATGSSGDGYEFARRLGHSIVDLGPALVPVNIRDYPFSELAGVSLADMIVSLFRGSTGCSRKIKEHRGDILFTHGGLSGPGILDLSRYIRAGDTLKLSIVAEGERQSLDRWIAGGGQTSGFRSLHSHLWAHPTLKPLPDRLLRSVLRISGIPPGLQAAQLSREKRNAILENLTALPLVVSDTCGYNQAMTTRGGVDTAEVDPRSMQSRLVDGLYLVGEVLDVDGDCGGYNLQAAFSTAMLAARSIKGAFAGGIQSI